MSNFDDREPGYYWIRYLEPIDARWTEPEVALLNRRGRWMLTGREVPLCFEVEILEAVSGAARYGDFLPLRGLES